jgi:hypothetical protein
MSTAVQAKDLVTISFKDKPGKITLRDHTNIKGDDYVLTNSKGESTSYTLDRTQQFDLSKPFDAKIVEGFRNHPIFGKALVIKSRTAEAKKVVVTYDLMEAAGTFIKKMGAGVGSFARVLGVHVNGLDPIEIKARLLEIAMKDPQRILDLKEDPNFALRVLLIEGLSVGVFTRREGIYMYGTTSLGSTEPLAIEWLSKNTDLTPALRKEVDGKLK